MSDNKKYYYLKLKEDFFDSPEIKVLESMPNGYKYSNLLLKLYLKALKFDGALRLNEYIPYNVEMISAVVGMDIDTVRVAFDLFKKLKLVEILNDGTIYMLEIQNFIGKSTTEADRKRNYRKRIEEEKTKLIENGQMSGQMSLKCPDKTPPEKEIEKEIEKDIDIKKNKKEKKEKKPSSKKIPTQTEIDEVINAYTSNEELKATLVEFVKFRKSIKRVMTTRALELLIKKLDKLANDDNTKIEILNESIMNGWNGIFPLKDNSTPINKNKGGFNNESRSNTSKNNEPSKGESKEEHDAKYWEEQNRILNEMLDF